MQKRYLAETILNGLPEKMVFAGGTGQVGKATMDEYISENYFNNPQYLSRDDRQDRKDILESSFRADADLLIFDEISQIQKLEKPHKRNLR